jgi:hypothetical protein
MNQRLVHDEAHKTALALLERLRSLVPGIDIRDAYAKVVEVVADGIQSYAVQAERLRARLQGARASLRNGGPEAETNESDAHQDK